MSSARDRRQHPAPRAGVDHDLGQRRQRQQQRGPGLGQQPRDQPDGGGVAQRQLDRGREAVRRQLVRPVIIENGSRSTGTCPPRAASSPASAGTPGHQRPVRSRDQPTDPVAEWMRGASLTATTAANPTPNRPTVAAGRRVRAVASRLLEARSVDSASTPAASSGAPVLAATSVPSRSVSRSRPGHARPRGRVGGVLRQLHHDPVPVAAERVVLLRVGVLAEPRGRRRPGVEHPAAQRRGGKGIIQLVRHSPTLQAARPCKPLTASRAAASGPSARPGADTSRAPIPRRTCAPTGRRTRPERRPARR